METQKIIHDEILKFIEDYFNETPQDIINKDIERISKMECEGTTAIDYFLNFNNHFMNQNTEYINLGSSFDEKNNDTLNEIRLHENNFINSKIESNNFSNLIFAKPKKNTQFINKNSKNYVFAS